MTSTAVKHLIAYQFGGPGTLAKRFFAHLGCVPNEHLNWKKEPVTLGRYKRIIPEADARHLECGFCHHPISRLAVQP